jgi:NAD(P)-dependent dehydrogenase (short-subunit alcohol dehydrogenase family)
LGEVRVNAIQPGFFITEQNRFLLTDKESGEPTERGRSVLQHTPAGRFGEPKDLVGALLFLASDASKFVTGAVIPVDGGFTAWWGI